MSTILDTLVTDRTDEDVSAGTSKGYYNASDLNRVGSAVSYLQDRLDSCGILPELSAKMNWSISDIPTQTQMRVYLSNIQSIRGALTVMASTPAAPESMERLTAGEANDIENILLACDSLISALLAVVLRSDQMLLESGNSYSFPPQALVLSGSDGTVLCGSDGTILTASQG